MTLSAATCETLFRTFRQLPAVQPREPTLLEITGYQRQELLSSNVLAFFLDPAHPHGLTTALLDALLLSAVQPRNHPTIWRLGYGSDLAYDAPLSQVQETVQGLFQLLGRSSE